MAKTQKSSNFLADSEHEQQPQQIDGRSTDGSALKAESIALWQSEQHYRSVIETQTELICRYRPDGTLTFVNGAYCRFFKRSPSDLIGLNFIELVPLEQQALIQEQLAELRQLTVDCPLLTHTHAAIAADGRTVWHQWVNQALFDEQGRLRELQATGRDITDLKATEQRLRDREHQLGLFFAQSLDGFFFMTLDEPVRWDETCDQVATLDYIFTHQRVTKANLAITQQYGLTEAEFLGFTLTDFFAEDIEAGKVAIRQLLNEGRLKINTQEHRADGTPIWIEGDYQCLHDELGRVTGLFGIQRDVTGLQQTFAALTASESKYRLIVENQTDLVLKLDVDGQVLFASPSYCELFDKTLAEVIDTNFQPPAHPDDQASMQKIVAALWQPPHTCQLEQRTLTRQGWRWLSWSEQAITDEAGNVTAIVAVGRDITDRKQMEQALRLSEQQFRNVLETLTLIAIMLDPDGNIIFCNDALLSLTGWQQDEVLGRRWNELFIPVELRATLHKIFMQTVESQDFPKTYENEIVTRSGSRRLIAWNNTAQQNTEGTVISVTSIGQDITDRKRAESHIYELSQRLSLATQSAQLGIWDLEAVTGLVVWDERMFEMYGRVPSTDPVSYESWLAQVHPDDHHLLEANDQAIAAGQNTIQQEWRVIRFDGEVRYVESHILVIRATDGTVQRLIGIDRDISDRKRNDINLQDTSERLRLATEAAQIGIWEWTVADNRLVWDERMHEIFGVPEACSTGTYQDCEGRVHPDDLPIYYAGRDKALAAGNLAKFDFRIIRMDGQVRHIESCFNVVRDEAGQPIRIIGTNRDISDRKQSALALAESNDMLNALMQNFPAIVELYDATGRYHKVNAVTSNVLGKPAAAIEGHYFEELHSPEVAALFRKRIRYVLETNRPIVVEDRRQRKGQEQILQSVLFPVLSRPDQPQLLGLVATDITALVTAQENLRQQAERERLLREITGNIRRSLDLDHVLRTTVTGIREFLATDRVVVYQFAANWSGDIIVESVGTEWPAILGETLRDPCFANKWIDPYRQGRISQIADINSVELLSCYRELLQHYQVQASLVLPLLVNDQLWGLLCIHHCQSPRPWPAEEIDFVRQLADQVEIAIQQAQLLAASQKTAQREVLRYRITQDIHRSLDLDKILATAAAAVREFLNTDRVLINRLSPTHCHETIAQSTQPAYSSGSSPALFNLYYAPRQVSQFLRGEYLQIDDVVAASSQQHNQALKQHGIRALLTLPLVVDKQLWGLLCIHHCRAPRVWQADEITFVREITAQVEIAIQQALLLQQTKIRAQREQVLNEIVSDIRNSLNLEEIMTRTTQKLLAEFQVGRCVVIRCAAEDEYFEYRACATALDMQDLTGHRLPLQDNPYVLSILAQEAPRATADVTDEAQLIPFQALAQTLGIGASLSVAIRHEGIVKGILCVHHTTPRTWTEPEQILIKQVADQLAIAIQQAELYQQAQAEIRQRQRLENQLRHDALHDSLTGLPNRTLFLERLQLALQRYQRQLYTKQARSQDTSSTEFAVLFLDLDRFKVINDSLGHTFGDQLLQRVAGRLTHCLRDTDIAARLGGDEFVILLEDLRNPQLAMAVVQRIHHVLALPILLDEREIFIRTSIGITFSSSYHATPEQIVQNADIAMYEAKKKGCEYVIFDASMHALALEQMNLEHDLQHAIKRGEFRLFFQPIVELKTGKIASFEALVRWQHPTQGLLYPEAFIQVAEDTGLIAAIDLWVLNQACQQLSQWQQMGAEYAHLTISVNLSGRQFCQPDLIRQIDQALVNANLASRYLKLEITESVLITNSTLAVQTLNEFRARNIQVCMDDFGTGYSSLSYLHQLPVDILKIDKSFILNLHSQPADARDYEIVKAIIHLARNLNLEVVAEGIENQDVLVYLQQNQCQFGQGYYFTQALAATAATHLLQQPTL